MGLHAEHGHGHLHREPKNIEHWASQEYKTHPTSVLYKHKNPVVRLVEKYRQDAVVASFRRFVQRLPEYRVLEIACQEGYTTRRLAGKNGTVVGIDVVADALKVAKRINPPSTRFIKANAERMPFKAAAFDVVVASEALEHMFNPEKVIAECFRVLRPGGLLIVTVPYERMVVAVKKALNAFGLFRLLFPDMFAEQSHFHVQSFTLSSMGELLRHSGFRILRSSLIPLPMLGPKIFVIALKQ